MAQKFILDGIGQLDGGTNSGVEPHLLQPNQTSFSTNVTYRGAYVGPRPGYRRINIDFAGNAALRQAVTKNRWQGGTFYTGDDGSASLVTAIAGRLFQFFPDSGGAPTATVVERTIPADPNPDTPLQAWLWQAENYVIWNDGQSIPVFFDGTTSRRSNSVQVSYGTTAANFTAPAIGDTVNVALIAPYSGPPNAVVLIDGALYQVTSGSVGYDASLTTLFLNAPITYPIGTQVYINPNLFGVQNTNLVFPAGVAGTTYGVGGISITLTLTQNFTGVVGDTLLLFGVRWKVTSSAGVFVLVKNDQVVTMPANLPAGTIILKFGSSLPNQVIGGFFNPFIAPPVGGTLTAQLDALYSGAAGQVVFVGNDQFTIAPIVPPPPGLNVVLINANDTAGTIHTAPSSLLSVPELPPGRMGCYGLGQNWMSLTDGVSFIASDSVGSSSGTQANNYRDAVLKTVQTTSVGGLGNFRVPGTVGDIRAMCFVAMLDTSLGQGPLQIFTPSNIFSCRAPISTALLTQLTTPILTEALKGSGGDGQYDLAQANADIIYGASDNAVRSLTLSRLDFDKWSNAPISREMARIIELNNRTLLQYGTAVVFNNRFLKSQLPTNGALGIYHQGLAVLNFDPLSSIRGKAPSIWDGFWTGLNIFQMITGTVNGTPRCYAFCFNAFTSEIELWEIEADTDTSFDNVTTPITWSFESASLFNRIRNKDQFDLVELLDGEIYLRDIRGIVNIQTWYRPDYSECWVPWHDFTICAQNNLTDDPKQYRTRLGLGEPDILDCEPTNNRPYRIGRSFQFRIQITGSCKLMGALFKSVPTPETEWSNIVCDPLCDTVPTTPCEPCKIQTPCLRFIPIFYNLGAGKSYTNLLLSFSITCVDGSIKVVYVQPGTIKFTLPYPVGYDGVYPPLVLGCVGGNIVRNIPTGATQEEIDAIVEEMINTCAQATAAASADCGPVLFTNDAVFFQVECPEGEVATYSGTLPSWITIDIVTNQLVGAAGVFAADTKEHANQQAQQALDDFANAAIGAGTLTCEPASSICTDGLGDLLDNKYQIQGYFDGLIICSASVPAGAQPVWDGVFNQHFDNGFPATQGWMSHVPVALNGFYNINGKAPCAVNLTFTGCAADVPHYLLTVGDTPDWQGEKVGGNTPEGVYTQVGGADPGPASITIELAAGVSTLAAGPGDCTS